MRVETRGFVGRFWFLISLVSLVSDLTSAESISILPFNDAFLLRRSHESSGYVNNSRTNDLFLPRGCPTSADQTITTQIAGHSYALPVYSSVHNLYCGVNVRLAQDRVNLDRPYVDIVALHDPAWGGMLNQRLCVTIQLTNGAGASVGGSCVLDERRVYEPFCLIRQIVPFSWFQLESEPSEHLISVSYSVKSECAMAELPLSDQRLRLLSTAEKFSVFAVRTQPDGQLTLLTRPNLTFSPDSMSTVLFHYKPNRNETEVEQRESIRLMIWIDSRFEIVSASPLDPKKWRMKAESAVGRLLTFTLSPLVDAIDTNLEVYLFAMLIRMRSDQERIEAEPKPSTSSSIVVQWMFVDANGLRDETIALPNGQISRRLTSGSDLPYVIVPITRSNDLVNVAVITGLQVTTPMRVLSISDGGRIRDVTAESHCVSAEPRLLKVSPTCTSVFVDGTEARGLAAIAVHVQFKSLRATSAFTVWFPRLPVSVWLADRTLNSVNDWRVPGWKPVDRRRRRDDWRRSREARQSVCGPRFQQSEVRVLATFQVVDEVSGETAFMSGHRDVQFDLTQVAADRVQSSDPQIVSLRRLRDGRLMALGNRAGSTRIVLKAATQQVDYGSSQVTVVKDRVSAIQLLVRIITDVHLSLNPRLSSPPHQYELVTQVGSQFTQQYQHGAMQIEIFYSDGERELLSDVDTHLYVLSIKMAAADAVRVRQQRGASNVVELVVLNDKLPADARLLTAEMRGPAVCQEAELPALAAGQVRLDTRFERQIEPRSSRLAASSSDEPADADRIQLNVTGSSSKSAFGQATSIGGQPLLALLLVFMIVFAVYHLISGHSRGLHDGYEKLVMPLLARLSSSGSLNSDGRAGEAGPQSHGFGQLSEGENTKEEWIWLSKRQLDGMSETSHFSQRSTLGISNGTTTSSVSSSSSDADSTVGGSGDTNRSVSISYRGSEISVFIAPQASVSVNEDRRVPHRNSTWQHSNGRSPRVRSTIGARGLRASQAMALGSSSVHDRLDEYCGRGFAPLPEPPHRNRRRSGGFGGAPPHRVPVVKDTRAPLPSYTSLVYAEDEFDVQTFAFSPTRAPTGSSAFYAPTTSFYPSPASRLVHPSAEPVNQNTGASGRQYPIRETVA